MKNNEVIITMHRLLLEEVDGNNAERFVAVTQKNPEVPTDIFGQIQWITAFWTVEINNTGAMNALKWVAPMHTAKTLHEFEIIAREQLIPVIAGLNLPRIKRNE